MWSFFPAPLQLLHFSCISGSQPPGTEPPPIILASERTFFFSVLQPPCLRYPSADSQTQLAVELLSLVPLLGVCFYQVTLVIEGAAAAVL